MDSIQKKIIYINIMMFIMLISGVTLGIIGLMEQNKDMLYTIIMESIAAPLIVGFISLLGLELKAFLKIRHTQIKHENNKK